MPAAVHVAPSYRDTGFTASYSFDPLTNVQFTRDQQITTRRGIVMARLRSVQRSKEVELLKFCFRKIGLPIVGARPIAVSPLVTLIPPASHHDPFSPWVFYTSPSPPPAPPHAPVAGEVKEPGYLEGGDFYPAGKDLCFIGVGLRSNIEAVEQLLREDLFGTTKVAVVRDELECSQARMHLDCIFNIVGDDVCLLAEDVIGEASPMRRVVDEYERDVRGIVAPRRLFCHAASLLTSAMFAPSRILPGSCVGIGTGPCARAHPLMHPGHPVHPHQESADPGPVGGYVEGAVPPSSSKPLYRLAKKGAVAREPHGVPPLARHASFPMMPPPRRIAPRPASGSCFLRSFAPQGWSSRSTSSPRATTSSP